MFLNNNLTYSNSIPNLNGIENKSIELALNTIGLNHNVYNQMNKQEFLEFYKNKSQFKNNINITLSLDLLLKNKLNTIESYTVNMNDKITNKNIINNTYSTQSVKNNGMVHPNTLPADKSVHIEAAQRMQSFNQQIQELNYELESLNKQNQIMQQDNKSMYSSGRSYPSEMHRIPNQNYLDKPTTQLQISKTNDIDRSHSSSIWEGRTNRKIIPEQLNSNQYTHNLEGQQYAHSQQNNKTILQISKNNEQYGNNQNILQISKNNGMHRISDEQYRNNQNVLQISKNIDMVSATTSSNFFIPANNRNIQEFNNKSLSFGDQKYNSPNILQISKNTLDFNKNEMTYDNSILLNNPSIPIKKEVYNDYSQNKNKGPIISLMEYDIHSIVEKYSKNKDIMNNTIIS